jgi:CheY-like chemotaxis protein
MADVLIVDDEPNNCLLLEKLLKTGKYSSFSCYSGKDACEEAERQHFDLILMDINMPDMDGIETIKRLRNQGYLGNIIIVTANPSGSNAKLGAKAGANGFLAKPVQPNICEIVKQFIG